jgi:glutamate-ammonia-ligase adenylyltransferase
MSADSSADPRRLSEFVRQACEQQPRLLARLQRQQAGKPQRAAAPPLPHGDDAAFLRELRRWRQREFALVAWRALGGMASLDETLQTVSDIADRAVRVACEAARKQLAGRRGAENLPPLIVVAMGKLGGRELNFSSDIDLVFLSPTLAEDEAALREPLLLRLGQTLIRMLDEQTADGFVFRVDMRLRPYGDSGALVSSFGALEEYLESAGRDWERYAWVKARAITGEDLYAPFFRQVVRPFVYRRYLDFGVFESLREMKALIEREVARRDLHDNIKLGPGGIREIEFIVQSFQLIRGGQEPRLQDTSLLRTLPRLVGGRLLAAAVATELHDAYCFLRRLENCLQMRADQQTHELPTDAAVRADLASAMGAPSWDALSGELRRHRDRVAHHFAQLLFKPRRGMDVTPEPATTQAPDDSLHAFAAPERAAISELLEQLRESALTRRLDETGRRRLQSLVADLLADLPQYAHTEAAGATAADAATVLRRLITLFEAIGARSAYFSLLSEQPRARARLIALAAQGEFLMQQLASYPLLLDELIDERMFDSVPDRAEMARELALRIGDADPHDEEQLVERLRHFQRTAMFRIAVADLSGRMPVMQVSDRLTDVAELVLEEAMRQVLASLRGQFGLPMCGQGRRRRPVRICAVGYGKLGGMELGYTSDLDLVFLHDSTGEQQHTDGGRPVDNQVFFIRYVQRLVHWLTMQSAAGKLYDVDMRLRPSGKGGMLITSVDAFGEYQQREAWTWEHQALLHARAVAGDGTLRQRFEVLRSEVLVANVRRDTLQQEVRDMRARMRAEKSRPDATRFDLKRDGGGIADIEFLAQFWALKWAAEYPPVAMYADTIRQLESVASADLVPQLLVDRLTRAYRIYRSVIHHRALDGQDAVVASAEFAIERDEVQRIWHEAMEQ